MSPAFISGAEKTFPNAEITFDKFHVSQLVQSRVLGTIVFVNPLGGKKVGELTNACPETSVGYFLNLTGD
jgi:hypothetical protein